MSEAYNSIHSCTTSCPNINSGAIAIVGVIISALGSLVTTIAWHYLRKMRCFHDEVGNQRHASTLEQATKTAENTKNAFATLLRIRQDVIDHSDRHYHHKEQSNVTFINQTKDLASHVRVTSETLFCIQNDVRDYGERIIGALDGLAQHGGDRLKDVGSQTEALLPMKCT